MKQAYLQFFGELNDFLAPAQRGAICPTALNGHVAVKHLIEALGVPHPEVEAIFANQQPVGFGYHVQPADRIEVHSWSSARTISCRCLLRPPLTPPLRFVLDIHLGQLATYLRLFGFDALYRNDYQDAELAQISSRENRILLTRDRGLLMRKPVVYGYWLRSTVPRRQLIALLQRYNLRTAVKPWRRCLRCNGLLTPAAKADVLHQLQPKTRLFYNEFQRCNQCRQVYWQGSHHAKMEAFVTAVLREVE